MPSRPNQRAGAMADGALIALGVLAVGDNVIFHWLLGFHRFKDGWPGSIYVEAALVVLGVAMIILGARRQLLRRLPSLYGGGGGEQP